MVEGFPGTAAFGNQQLAFSNATFQESVDLAKCQLLIANYFSLL
jgi:hypothetical protein